MLNLKWSGNAKERTVTKIKIENCYPQKNVCKVETDKFKIEISLDKNIFYLKQFAINVLLSIKDNLIVESINIDFKMTNMDMGKNYFKLERIQSENIKQNWHGNAILPVCVTKRTEWFSELELVAKDNIYVFSFPLSVQRFIN